MNFSVLSMSASLEQVHKADDKAVGEGSECHSRYISPEEAAIPPGILIVPVTNPSIFLLAVDRHLDILRVGWCSRSLEWHSAVLASLSVD